jgi:Icc-related predicted phosphoesterase
MIVDCVSDLHGFYPELEGGDLLIIAGDLTAGDTKEDWKCFNEWSITEGNKYRKTIVIAGNHDNLLQQKEFPILWPKNDGRWEYLEDNYTLFDGLKIWGSPWTTTFKGMNPHCKAFTVDTQDQLSDKLENIPHDVDILVTHSPPYGILDVVYRKFHGTHIHAGSYFLYAWFKYCQRPKLHVFGHIHEGYGHGEFFYGYNDTMVKSVNASHVDENYEPMNKPIRIVL